MFVASPEVGREASRYSSDTAKFEGLSLLLQPSAFPSARFVGSVEGLSSMLIAQPASETAAASVNIENFIKKPPGPSGPFCRRAE